MSKKSNFLAICCVSLLCSFHAEAADNKIYPGAMGVKTAGADPAYSQGAISNPSSTSWMYVTLPLVNDTYTQIEASWVRVLDRHYNSNVSCSVNSAYWNNTHDTFYGSWGANRASTGSSDNVQVLDTGTATGGSTRHYFMKCSIPPTYSGNRSYIVSYQAGE